MSVSNDGSTARPKKSSQEHRILSGEYVRVQLQPECPEDDVVVQRIIVKPLIDEHT